MWVTKLLISPVKNRFFCPVGGLAGGCGAGCISQDTYLLYDIHDNVLCLVQLLYVAMRYSDKRDIHDT